MSYSGFVGKTLKHPFFPDRSVMVIADDYVDREFGTGAVKLRLHDPNDFDMGRRHDLPMINIMTFDGRINGKADRSKAWTDMKREKRSKRRSELSASNAARRPSPSVVSPSAQAMPSSPC